MELNFAVAAHFHDCLVITLEWKLSIAIRSKRLKFSDNGSASAEWIGALHGWIGLQTSNAFILNRNKGLLLVFSLMYFLNQHHDDFSPNQNGKFIGWNIIMVLTFFSFSSRTEALEGSHWFFRLLYVFPPFKIFRCGHLQAFLGAFFLVQRKKL